MQMDVEQSGARV
jgi:hypothetical protein